MNLNLPFIILGAGGHGRVLAETLLLLGEKVIGFTDPEVGQRSIAVNGIPVLGSDEVVQNYSHDQIYLANGIGSTISTLRRRTLYSSFRSKGYKFRSVMHPSSTISQSVILGDGVQIMAGAIVQTGAVIGDNSLVNTGAVVDHDCRIGKHVHVGPRATLCGGVSIHDGCHIGVGATVIQQIVMGSDSLVAAGAVVIRDVPKSSRVEGVPARIKN